MKERLISYHPLDGGGAEAVDYSGNENNGTLGGGVTQEATGLLDSTAYSFDGVDDRVELPDLGLNSSESFSVSVWVNRDGTTFDAVFGKFEDPDFLEIAIRNGGAGNVPRFNVGHSGGNIHSAEGTTAIPTGEWTHLTLVYEHITPETTLYLNGAVEASDSGAIDDFDTANGPWLGDRNDGNSPLTGRVEDARVYDKALSPQEISYLANVPSRATATSEVKRS